MQLKIFEFNDIHVNTYVLWDETKEAAIIDCGAFQPNEHKELKEFIDANGLQIKQVLNTHLHFDHTLGNRFLWDTYGLKPQYHEVEETMPGQREQVISFGEVSEFEEGIHAGHFLKEGDVVAFGNTKLQVLETPGHSPAGLSFYCKEAGCVFTGDTLFRFDIGRTDLWGGNEQVLLNSIRTKLLTLPGETIVYPGHALHSTIAKEKKYNKYL
ncbi:MAG: MBL fold metallo-hydrolase [Candidatus Symbiothrix sp.]|jgi:glyoxylase-like metal-dependent hydrolase (beta-lactamase superfamily II)|nr:MBL fold metallo-hydrolase [Candidatus Symbiothrix sp.]